LLAAAGRFCNSARKIGASGEVPYVREGSDVMGLSATHLLLLLVIVVLLFGRNKISDLMGDVARGIKSFKKGLAEDETPAADTKIIDNTARENVERDRSKAG
jgi:sec-independent protein translocase protein TatA